jgi:Holliday junction resolvasome RuvABC endonuclease subunit
MVNKPNILAIDPGGKELGVVVLEGQQLLFYAVKPTKLYTQKQLSLQYVKTLVQNLMTTYEISALVIKQVPNSYINAKEINKVANYIKKLVQSKNISVFEYSPKVIRSSVCRESMASRKQVANRLAMDYPELARFRGSEGWQERYYGKIFTALALGLTCFDQLKTNN